MKRIIISLVLALATAAGAEESKIRVYVFAELEAAGGASPNFKELSDSVKDLKKQISKRKHLELATAEDADIVVEILDRWRDVRTSDYTCFIDCDEEERVTGSFSKYEKPQFFKVISYSMTAGEFKHQAWVERFDGHDLKPWGLVSWSRIAGSLSKEVERWAKKNRARLLERRQ